jgi:uncharacterized membrane protein YjfL (UPF0719 family)
MPELLSSLIAHLPFYAYALLLTYLSKLFYQKTSKVAFTEELTEKDNPAFGACLAGYLLGVAVALTGAFPADSTDNLTAVLTMTYSGVLTILLMRASIWINDLFILKQLCIKEEMIRDQNIGAGAAVAGSSIGTGLIVAGALTGNSESPLHAIRDILIYWAVGQALFVVGSHLFFRTVGYDLRKTLEEDNNTAAGISLGGFLVALGILLWSVLRNASSDVLVELGVTGMMLLICGPLLFFTRTLTEKLILPRVYLAKEIALDKNTAAGVICAAASICTALLLAAAIATH